MQERNSINRYKPIGFCDSGVGGLSVLSKCRQLMPYEDFVYFGDLKNVPYGSKLREELLSYLTGILDFFVQKDVKAVVLACNTTSAVVYDMVKDKYPFEIYPIIQSCARLLANLDVERLGVFATAATINSGVYEREIKKYNPKIEVFSKACSGWVEIVENNAQNEVESVRLVEKYLSEMMINQPEKLVLGCTHYPFLAEIVTKFVEKGMLIDPADYFAEFIKRDLSEKTLENDKQTLGEEEFYVSANPEQFRDSARLFYEINGLPILI